MNRLQHIPGLVWGIMSSLIASALFVLFVRIFEMPFLNQSIPLWILIVFVILFVGTLTASIYDYKTKPKLLFYIPSQFPDNQFQASLIQKIIQELEFHKIQLVVMFPSENLDGISQQRLFENVLKYKKYFIGGFIVPAYLDGHERELIKFVDDFKKPILFIDAPPPFREGEFPDNSAFIGYNNFDGGKSAATAMCYELNKLNARKFNVLIIASKVVSQRQSGFEEHLTDIMKSKLGKIECIDDGHFRREDGSHIFNKVLNLNNSNYLFYQGIFCTNDEMALGVLDVINDIPNFPKDDVVIIGYDAITEITELIKHKATPIKNSVYQNPYVLASESVATLVRMLKGSNVTNRDDFPLGLFLEYPEN